MRVMKSETSQWPQDKVLKEALAEYARAASEVLVTESQRVLQAERRLLDLGFKFR